MNVSAEYERLLFNPGNHWQWGWHTAKRLSYEYNWWSNNPPDHHAFPYIQPLPLETQASVLTSFTYLCLAEPSVCLSTVRAD
jgi:hypothetical protein